MLHELAEEPQRFVRFRMCVRSPPSRSFLWLMFRARSFFADTCEQCCVCVSRITKQNRESDREQKKTLDYLQTQNPNTGNGA